MDEYELDELGNPILDELGNPKLKKAQAGSPASTPPQVDELGNSFWKDLSEGTTGAPVIDAITTAGRQLYQGFGDQIPKSFALGTEILKTGLEGGSSIKDLVKQRDPADFQKYVRGNFDSPYEFKGDPKYSGVGGFFTPFDFEEAWAKYGDQYVKDAKLAPIEEAIDQRFLDKQLPRRLATNEYAEQQNKESAETLGNTPQSYKDVKDFAGGVNFATNLATQQLWQIPLTVATRGLSGTIMESAEVYDQQLELLAQKHGISRDEVIRRRLDSPHEGQLYAVLAGQIDRLSAGQLVNTVRKGGMKALQTTLNIASETITEPVQGILEEAGAASGAGEEFDFFKSLTSPKRIDEALGGLFGGSASMVSGLANEEIAKNKTGNPAIDDQIASDANEAIKSIINAAAKNESENSQSANQELDQTTTTPDQKVVNVEGATKEPKGTLGEQLVGKEEVVTPEPAIEPVPTKDLVNQFNEEGALLGATEESKKETKAVATEQIADFLRGKVSSRGQVIDFVEQWNELHPERTITDTDGNNAWNLIKPVKPQVSNETVTQTTAQALKDQIKTFYRGVDKGVRKGQQLVNETLIPKVQEALKTSNLTSRQTSAILTKLKRTNLFTPGSIDKLNTYIDKVVGKADYAEKISQAEELQDKIKNQSKNKALPPNIREVSREFSKLDVDNFDVDDYLQLGEHISNGLVSTGNNNYKAFDEFKIRQKINQVRTKQELDAYRQELGNLSEAEMAKLIEEDSVDEYLDNAKETDRKEKIDNLRAKVDYAKIGLADADFNEVADESEREIINVMLEADTSDMSASDMLVYIRVADNIILNGDFGGSDRLWAKLEAKTRMKNITEATKNLKIDTLNQANTTGYSQSQITDTLYNNNRVVGKVESELGISQVLEEGSKTNNTVDEKIDGFGKEIERLDKKYRGDLTHPDSRFKMILLNVFARNTDGVSHIEQVKKNIQDDLNEQKLLDPKQAAAEQKIFDKYKDKIKSSDDAIALFKKEEPKVFEAWDWFGKNVFDDKFTAASLNTTQRLHNQSLITEKNYRPETYKRTDEESKSADESISGGDVTPSLKPKQASTTLKADRTLRRGHTYNRDVYGSMFRAYKDTLYKNQAGRFEQLLYEITRRPEFEKAMGGRENKNKFIKTLKKRVANQNGWGDSVAEGWKTVNDALHIFKNLGVVKALGNLTQLVTQSAPTWIASSWSLGKDAGLMFTPPNKNFTEGVIKKHMRISEAGKRHGNTDLGDASQKYLSEDAKWKFNQYLGKLRRGTQKLSHFALMPLTWGDVAVRRRAATAFYIQRLRELGVNLKNVDLNTEHEKQSDPKRREARAYADSMVSKLQVPSNRAEMSEFMRSRGLAEVARNIVLPFSGFPLNTKSRIARSIGKMKTNPAEGSREFTGVMSESIAFAALKTYFVAGIWAPAMQRIFRSMFDLEPPEEKDPNEEDFFQFGDPDNVRKIFTNVVNDFFPFALGMGTKWSDKFVNRMAFQMRDREKYDEYTYDQWMAETKGIVNEPFESTFSDAGVVGVGLQKVKDIVDAGYDASIVASGEDVVYYSDLYGDKVADVEDMHDLVFMNALMESAGTIAPQDLANAWRTVYKQQLKEYKPDNSRRRRSKKK